MSVDVSKLDFTGMMCNVMALPPKRNPLDVFDMLQKYDQFHIPLPMINKAKVLFYIPLIYDRASPLHDIFDDILKKKMFALELSRFIKQEDGRHLSIVEKMIQGGIPEVNAMVVRYTTLNQSALYYRYTILNEVQFREAQNLLEDKTNISDFSKVGEEISKVEAQLLAGDKTLIPDLTKYYFQDKLELRPEDMAAKLANGRKPIELKEVQPQ